MSKSNAVPGSLRWRVWIVAILAHSMNMFHRAAMGPMADQVMADFGITAIAFGVLGSIYFYVYAAMQLPSGVLSDTLGPRKVITGGLLVAGAGSLVMGLAPDFALLCSGRVLVSLGASVVWLSVLRLVFSWFKPSELGTVTGMSSALGNLGGLASTTPLAALVVLTGWRLSLTWLGAITLVLAVVGIIVIRDHPPGAVRRATPGQARYRGQAASRIASARTVFSGLAQAVRTKSVWAIVLACFGVYGAYASFFSVWAVVYVMQVYGLPREAAANFVLAGTLGMMIGAPLAGFLSDRIFRLRKLPGVAFALIGTGALAAIALAGGKPPQEVLLVLCFLSGLGTGPLSLIFVTAGEVTPVGIRGTATGLVNMGGFVAPAIAQPLIGLILDAGWKGEMIGTSRLYPVEAYTASILLCLGLSVAGLIGMLLTKETHCRNLFTHADSGAYRGLTASPPSKDDR